MKLTKKKILEATEASLEHWRRNKRVKGELGGWYWSRGSQAENCPLCLLSHKFFQDKCGWCPLSRIGKECGLENSPWQETIIGDKKRMIEALEEAIKYIKRTPAKKLLSV